MITTTAPFEYRKRPAPRTPQTVRLCLDCGGDCVDLPLVGVACLECHGQRSVKVTEKDAFAMRCEIYKAIELAETAPVALVGITDLLSKLAAVPAEYPAELMARTRAEYVAKIETQIEAPS